YLAKKGNLTEFAILWHLRRPCRGLGLSAVHGIMQGHRGFLKLRSKPGEGSSFEMYFPAMPDVQPEPKAAPHRIARRASGTILVVDDESVVRNFARAALESRGYRVLVAENGEEGVELFRRAHVEIDAVLLDLTMPVMDGAEALEKMRGISSKVPVVLASGFSHSTAAERFHGKGLAGFLGKPFTIDQLTEVVEAALSSSPAAGERSI
ncbi:MAG: response regulator, partial [Terriglobia bacterium]